MFEAAGRALGWIVSPIFGAVSFVRQARTFHPRGPTFHAHATLRRDVPRDLSAIARRLEGPALVRFSGALWKHAEGLLDVLGCAIRFTRDERESADASGDDQDVLFATIRRPWTMIFSPFTTDVRDYLANDYFAVSPFDVGLARSIYFRLHPRERSHAAIDGDRTRADKLLRDVALGTATLVLEVADRPFGPWTPILDLELERVASVDGEALRFRPFRDGRGITPGGFVHALRRGVYAMSQRARPSHAQGS